MLESKVGAENLSADLPTLEVFTFRLVESEETNDSHHTRHSCCPRCQVVHKDVSTRAGEISSMIMPYLALYVEGLGDHYK